MFKNRHFQVKVVKDEDDGSLELPVTRVDLTEVITPQNVKNAFGAVVSAIILVKVADAACKIAVARLS